MPQKYNPLISIITVVYNGADSIKMSLDSVLQQSYKNIEYLIIDGGSTDGTLDIISQYKERNIRLLSEKDNGIYDAMNKGLKLATGDWTIFLGADDLLAFQTVIEELVENFKDPNGIYYGNAYIKTINRLYNGRINKWSLALGGISHQAIFYPKSIYKYKEYNESYRVFADHIYNIELFKSYSSKFYYLPKLISIYSGTGVSSHVRDDHYERNLICIIRKNFGLLCSIYVYIRRMLYTLLKFYKK